MGWFEYNTGTSMYVYNSHDNLVANSPANFFRLDPRVDGTGFVTYDGNIYYNEVSNSVLNCICTPHSNIGLLLL